MHCGRESCLTCLEQPGACMKKGVVYRFTCQICLGLGKKMEYVRESYRSSWDRAQEHLTALRNKDMESPLWEHHQESHPNMDHNFSMKLVAKCKKPLQTQTLEGLLVSQAKEGTLMNRKGEWGQNLPSKFEVVDDAWGDQEKMPKRKKWKQSVGESLGEKSESVNRDRIERQQRKRQKRDGKVKEKILGEQSLAETWGAGGPESENSNQGVSQDASKRSL